MFHIPETAMGAKSINLPELERISFAIILTIYATMSTLGSPPAPRTLKRQTCVRHLNL